MGSMQGKSGLVTASGAGIGRAAALAFAREGANVLVSDISEAMAAETVELIRAAGGTAEYFVADASKEEAAEQLVARVVELWGSLDFAHNNAGIGAPNAPFTEQEGPVWERMFNLNVFGTMYFMKHELRQMQKQGHGAIVNTASLAGKSGNPGLSAYTATKWSVIGMTKVAAAENAAAGIRVNAFCPGGTMTAALAGWKESSPEAFQAVADRVPMKRMAEPAEQAEAAVFLCSDAASYITGVALGVDGGDGILGHN
ncbi:glucose 1-dehydrogenase [Leucobacter sp. cx-328]|uniref:SDR family NAD(P)-dependent oxidoreductase n=1 Tax=unclassified Leucobacter TaxID=2621730 RepID=UPI00165E31D2|nr:MULTISPECIES: glucose 1-dehydrogenase [unclassified Leucobacter]MBC9943442.1 glucose 1-dehydrogenase [Leucobacter sp. cx-328]